MNAIRRLCRMLYAAPLLAVLPFSAHADAIATAKIDTGDTAWVLMCSGLVLLMTPGLAFFYGGLVRRKNVLSVLMQCFMAIGLITLQWVLLGYSLSFGPDVHGFTGNLSWAMLRSVGAAPFAAYAPTIPHSTFAVFQAMFAIITPALILGAFAERMKFSAYCVFIVLWSTLVYDPIAHWVWGQGGFLKVAGTVDFAGGIVVHISAGVAALATTLVLGRRQGFPARISPPHNLPFAVLGAGLLWFGWFGFNAGSALGANGVASNALLATHVAGAAAAVAWAVLDWVKNDRSTMLGVITGAVAGLASVTPAAGYVTPAGALLIGILGAVICYAMVAYVKEHFAYDDSLDAFGVHGIGGLWGVIATGIFATTAVNPAGVDGLLAGNAIQLWIQTKAALVSAGYSLGVSYLLLKGIELVMGLRVSDEAERIGLDLTQHREAGYTLVD